MENTTKPKLSASALKTTLWDTLLKVKNGEMDSGQADSVATQAREILRTTTVQLKVASQSKRSISKDVLDFAENKKAS